MIWRCATLTTYGEIGAAAVEIARAGDGEEAQRFLDAYASEIHGWKQARRQFNRPDSSMDDDPRAIACANVGYVSGYYDAETSRLVRDIFDVDHPIFGRQPPATAEEAIELGTRAALDARARPR